VRPYFYLGDNRGLTQLSGGELFYVYTKDRSITPWILIGGIWETFVDDILCALIRPGDCFLDIGANQGYYTVKIGRRTGPTGRVFSFEPNPLMYRFLSENIEINALQPITTAFQVAVADKPGRMTMEAPVNYPGGGRVLVAGETGAETVEVDVARIDDLLPPGQVVDLIKIDVEGFEPLALRGMAETLARSPDCPIVCEIAVAPWSRFCDPVSELRRIAAGRRLFRIQHDGVLDEMDDNILSALDPSFVSYVLMLPATDERYAQIARFVRQPPAVVDDAEAGA